MKSRLFVNYVVKIISLFPLFVLSVYRLSVCIRSRSVSNECMFKLRPSSKKQTEWSYVRRTVFHVSLLFDAPLASKTYFASFILRSFQCDQSLKGYSYTFASPENCIHLVLHGSAQISVCFGFGPFCHLPYHSTTMQCAVELKMFHVMMRSWLNCDCIGEKRNGWA